MSSSVGGESHQIPMQDASTIILESVMSILAFYATFHTLAKYTTSLEFRQNWQIGNAVALDIANKSISALFATISSLTGTYVLITYGTEDYSSQVITIFMPMAIGYFLYDMGAMCQVHLARLDEKSEKDSKNQVRNPLLDFNYGVISVFWIWSSFVSDNGFLQTIDFKENVLPLKLNGAECLLPAEIAFLL